MIDWLIEKGVDFPPNALKNDLWEIIKTQLEHEPDYSIDKLIQKMRPDITIERLPPYHVRTHFLDNILVPTYFKSCSNEWYSRNVCT